MKEKEVKERHRYPQVERRFAACLHRPNELDLVYWVVCDYSGIFVRILGGKWCS